MPGEPAPGAPEELAPPGGESLPPGSPESADARGVLGALMAVQDLDTAISQLEHRRASLPERALLASAEAALARNGARAGAVDAERAGLLEQQNELEAEIAATTARSESLEQRLYAARGTPARDLQAMDDEIGHLRIRRTQLEDAELDVMEALEPLDAEVAGLGEENRSLLAQSEGLRQTIGEGEAAIDEELRERRSARERAVLSVPADLRARYEALRARLGGTGAARLVGNRCSGCHLELPSMEVDRIRHLPPGTVVTCEQCGRILVSAEQ